MVSTSAARASHGASARTVERTGVAATGPVSASALRAETAPARSDSANDRPFRTRASVSNWAAAAGLGAYPGSGTPSGPKTRSPEPADPNDDEAAASVAAECVRHVGDRIGLRLAVGDEDAGAALRRPVEETVALRGP